MLVMANFGRLMRLAAVVAVVALVATNAMRSGQAADVNSQVLSFAKAKLGDKVGDGECATLAIEAVKAAGGKRFSTLGPSGNSDDYVWGKKVTVLDSSVGRMSSIQPGDIIQFRDVSFRQETRTTKNGQSNTSSKTFSYRHHTAIVVSVKGEFITVLHQNVGSGGKSADAKRIVQQGTVWGESVDTLRRANDGTKTATTYTFERGTMSVYRPFS